MGKPNEWVFEVFHDNKVGKPRWYRYSRRMRYDAAIAKMIEPRVYDLSIVRIRNVDTKEIIPGALFA